MKKIERMILILTVVFFSHIAADLPNANAQISKVNRGRPYPSEIPLPTPEDPSEDASNVKNMQSQAFSIINSLNPMAKEGDTGPTDPLAALNDPQFNDTLERLTELQKLLESPWVRKYMQVMTHRDVVGGLKKLSSKSKEDYKKLFLFQGGFLVLLFLIQLWFFGQPMGFLKRVFMKLVFLGITVVGMSFVVPSFVLGKDYYNFIRGLIGAIRAVI